jgi:vancomycin resistance protein YoaR
MKKLWIYILILTISIGITAFAIFYFNKNLNDNKSSYTAEKTNTNNTTNQNYSSSTTNTNFSSNANNLSSSPLEENSTTENTAKPDEESKTTEQEIASFSTKIYNKDSERQNNITITCSTLNNTKIPAGTTFSFCNTVGKATSDKGYQEADIIIDGKKEQGLGGGNCQVSTTLYNAVLAVPNLQVTERHEHSGRVPYVAEGKDAAVAYGSYDFKFVNNTGATIKILAQNTADAITIKLIKIT